MRVLICGGRDYNGLTKFHDEIAEIFWKKGWTHPKDAMRPHRDVVIISGMAKGADTLAVGYAKINGLILDEYPADWDTHGKRAGFIRNQQMIDEGKPDLVIAFPTNNSRGTYDMINRAKRHNIEVIVIDP